MIRICTSPPVVSQTKPPLFDLFIWLREVAGLPLTIEQYFLLRQALEGGFGLTSRRELKRICRLLWIKSLSSQLEKFNQYFDLYFVQLSAKTTQEKPPHSTKPTSTQTNSVPNSSTTESNEPITPHTSSNNYLQIPTAMRGGLLSRQSQQPHNYQLEVKEFPVTQREFEQDWRYLRLMENSGALTTIDIPATVQKISQEGIFLEPVMIPNRINRLELLLLIDNSNSMVPFNLLIQKLLDSLPSKGLRVDSYYFSNCPRDYFYLDPHCPDVQLIEELLPKLHLNRTIAVIVSDGGAARGGINRDRLELTVKFLESLNVWVHHTIWLNPMPYQRWQGTTAQSIAQLVPMFELNATELKQAMRKS